MVKVNHVDSPHCNIETVPQFEDGSAAFVAGMHRHQHHHTRNISSSTSSQASSTTSTNLIADWSSTSSSSTAAVKGPPTLDSLEPKLKWTPDDLIHTNLSDGPTSSSCEDFDDDDERIKLLCGDDSDEWPEVDTGQKGVHTQATILTPTFASSTHNRRRRVLPKFSKVLHKVRRKFNWQLLLLLAVVLVITVSLSQLNEYQYGNGAGIMGWNINTSRDTAVYLRPDHHTAILEPRVMDRGKRYLLLVIVCSAVDNFSTRQTIRQTWANSSEFNYAKFFHRMHAHAAHGLYAAPDRGEMQRVMGQLYGGGQLGAEGEGMRRITTRLPDVDATDGAGEVELLRALESQVIFLVGRPQSNDTQQAIVEESNTFGDVIQEDFVDTYNNLTLKSVMLLKWIARFNDNANRVKYVMKCDDDTFLNVPNLVHVLLGGTVPVYRDTFRLYSEEALRRRNWLDSVSLMGYLFHSARPIRDVTSKWYAPRFMYRRKVFPNYLSGSGYVMEATQTAKDLFSAALQTPIFHLEDVYVTGLCASRRTSTMPFHNPLFSFHRLPRLSCSMRGMITQHPMTAADIRQEYDRLTNVTGGECEQPAQEVMERVFGQKASKAPILDAHGSVWWSLMGAMLGIVITR